MTETRQLTIILISLTILLLALCIVIATDINICACSSPSEPVSGHNETEPIRKQ